jgi:hypothetical protein
MSSVIENALDIIRRASENASAKGQENTARSLDALRWYVATGRSFTGVERAVRLLSAPSQRAFFARLARLLTARAVAKRGASTVVVPADLDNVLIARAFGFGGEISSPQLDLRAVIDASEWACNLPYAKRATLPKAA